jgi:hypothetical protein
VQDVGMPMSLLYERIADQFVAEGTTNLSIVAWSF